MSTHLKVRADTYTRDCPTHGAGVVPLEGVYGTVNAEELRDLFERFLHEAANGPLRVRRLVIEVEDG